MGKPNESHLKLRYSRFGGLLLRPMTLQVLQTLKLLVAIALHSPYSKSPSHVNASAACNIQWIWLIGCYSLHMYANTNLLLPRVSKAHTLRHIAEWRSEYRKQHLNSSDRTLVVCYKQILWYDWQLPAEKRGLSRLFGRCDLTFVV